MLLRDAPVEGIDSVLIGMQWGSSGWGAGWVG